MIREDVAQLLETIEGPYHPRIERSREKYFARLKKKKKQDKASKFYEDEVGVSKGKRITTATRIKGNYKG